MQKKRSSKKDDLKMLGRIQAGFAAPAEEELADTITLGEYLIRHKESTYLLKVAGDSMQEAGILEGDMVVFERRHDAKPGDIVIALTEDGYTIKYLRKNPTSLKLRGAGAGKYYLEAAKNKYPRIVPNEGEIIGVVTATFRTYFK